MGGQRFYKRRKPSVIDTNSVRIERPKSSCQQVQNAMSGSRQSAARYTHLPV